MKKRCLLLLFIAMIITFTACDKTCTCINPNQEITEIDANIMEDCNSLSNNTIGDCY